jgi:Zn-dependent protease with chaperone function
MLMASSVVQVLSQGTLAVGLAYWLPAYFFERFSVKLLAMVAICAGLSALVVIIKIFQRPKSVTNVEGEQLTEAAAPRLWQRVREIAARLQTAVPDHIIGGIDANFFVTEMPVTVGTKVFAGRTLFVSVPLLRILSTAQADAVLGHELAHFSGGDTSASARLNPALLRYDHYTHGLQEGMTIVVFPIMQLYRLLLQLSLSRDSRAREFQADRTAASVTSAQAMIEALVKVAAYATYRGKTEEELINGWERLNEQFGLGASVAHGLLPYSTTEQFVDEMRTAPVPHPFDSHPPMAQRMQNVGYQLDVAAFGGVVAVIPDACWADEIDGANEIEGRLWAAYEQRFAARHEQVLAYRYEPATEEERAIVLKYFPPVGFSLKEGQSIEINVDGIMRSGEALVPWDDLGGLKYENSIVSGEKLDITLKGASGTRSLAIKVKGLSKQKTPFMNTINHFWRRHQVMRAEAAKRA